MEENNEDKKKSHREPHSGRKAEKKKTKKETIVEQRNKQHNLKAFAFNSAVRAERRFRRTQDIQTKKQHVPVVDRTPFEPPPIMVVVVGPPKVGKSTLIQCLVKNFTRQPLTSIKGPITVVSGKKRRITLMECNNDINCMIDLAKVADLILLLIDASFGFEMEIFEFLNICQVHGMPKVMGVLTHLDMLKQTKILKRTKKMLKHRFWTEVYAGAKVFYLSGLLHGEYLRNEIKNLGRFISVMKIHPLTWQTTHSYLVADRMEDLTPPELIRQNPTVNRTVSLYGFVRGIPLNKSNSVHIPGCGDSVVGDICYLPDPCPLPDRLKKRSLVDKERLIYAPFSGVGGIVYDKDAVYIELAGSHSHHNQVGGKGESERELVTSLLETKNTLDSKIARSQLQILSDTAPITAKDFKMNSVKDIGNTVRELNEEDNHNRRKVVFESDHDCSIKVNPEVKNNDEKMNCDFKYNDEIEYIKINNEVGDIGNDITSSDEDCSDWENINNKYVNGFSDERSDNLFSSTKSLQKYKNIDESFTNLTSKNFKKKNDVERKKSITKNINYLDYKTDQEKILLKRTTKTISDEDCCSNDEERYSIIQKDQILFHNEVSTIRYQPVQSGKKEGIRSKIHEALGKLQNIDKKKCSAVVKDISISDNESCYSSEDLTQSKRCLDEMCDDELSPVMKSVESDLKQDNAIYVEEKFNSANGIENNIIDVTWKTNLAQKAADAYFARQNSMANLWKLVYGQEVSGEKREKNVDDNKERFAGMFASVGQKQEKKTLEKDTLNALDTSKHLMSHLRDWSNDQVQDTIKDCFVTGKWNSTENASDLLRLDDISDAEDDDDVYGDFVDFDTDEGSTPKKSLREKKVDEENEGDTKKTEERTGKQITKATLLEKKRKLKKMFDAEYDEKDNEDNTFYDSWKKEASMQTELNRVHFEGLDDEERVQIEGFRAGMYVRVELQHIPCELVTHFDPTYPLIIGSLQPGEENVGFVKVRIKKHRWCNRILKTRDPLIVSMGWRRFQTLAIYSKLEDNLRHRMLKYTPEHVICMAHFWGPITRPNTGLLAVQDVAIKQAGFRIIATGSVVDCNKSTDVTKKLKLTGIPFKIYKKTAFIRGMFNSALEVAKFEGARIKTVSGIRGIIKKAVNKPEGAFRATFEDKIQLSDIVFCRTWYKVEIPKLYYPVTSLLLPFEEKNSWRGMKTVGQLKREKGLQSEPQRDSIYTPIEREPMVFKPLVIPRKLQKDLPFKDKPKVLALERKKEKVSVVRDIYESKVASMMKKMKTIYSQRQEEVRKAKVKRLREFKRQIDFEERKKLQRQRKMKKNVFRALSKSETKKPELQL